MFFKTIVLFIVFCVFLCINGECEKCPTVVTKHYYELGCSPIRRPGECCPSSFNCQNFTQDYERGRCHYQGIKYDVGESMPNTALPDCTDNCKCTMINEIARFVCTSKVCPETRTTYSENCIFQRDLDECCSVHVECKEEKIKDLRECILEDGVYREGEIMYPWMDQCYRCICDSGFNSTISVPENPNCKANEHCNIELYQLTRFQRGCAPVYYGVNPCCPTSWRCPEEPDEIVPGNERYEISDPVCKFGKLTLHIGDMLKDVCVTCECLLPPLLTCTQSHECNPDLR